MHSWQCPGYSLTARLHVCICAAKPCVQSATFIRISSIFPSGQCMWTKQDLNQKTCKLWYQIQHSSHLKSKASLLKNQSKKTNKKRIAVSHVGRKWDLLGLNAGVEIFTVVYTPLLQCTHCSFNYKADAAEKIRKEHPVVFGEKIQKI